MGDVVENSFTLTINVLEQRGIIVQEHLAHSHGALARFLQSLSPS
jgi:hypothetical protein